MAPQPLHSAVDRLLEAMPKAELHLHLDGSLRIGTALELAGSRGVDAPTTWRGMFDALALNPVPVRRVQTAADHRRYPPR